MTSGANQQNSAEKNRGRQVRKSSKRPASSMDGGNKAKKVFASQHSDEEMEDEASGSNAHNFVANFNHKENARTFGPNERLKKKLVIKNFKSRPNGSEEVAMEVVDMDNDKTCIGRDWAVLRDNVDAILEDRKTITTMETLFSKVRSLCDKDQAKPLYDHLVQIIIDFANLLKESLTSESYALMEDTCEQYLAKFGKIWDTFPVKTNLIRNIFLFLDRMTLGGGDSEMLPLWDCSMQIYQKTFFPEITRDFRVIKLFSALYMAMNRMMLKYTVDSPLKSLIDMLSQVHVDRVFTGYLINMLREHYNKERVEKVARMTCNEYMTYAEDQIHRYSEIVRVNFDDPATLKEIQATLLNCLVQQAYPEILRHDFDKLMDSGNIPDIRRTFELCRQCAGGEDEVRSQFSNYMKQRGEKIVSTHPDEELIAELLVFKRKVDVIISGAFKSATDPTKMRQCLSDAFESFVNKNVEKAAELISKHFHGLLHSGNKNVTDDTTLDQMVDDAIVLFRYLRGKDVFEAYYKRGLAKRLFLERSASVDAEKMVLCKLKTECGAAFTYKLEGMFRDMDASENYGALFSQYLEHNNKEKANFSVRVITPEFWPTYEPYEINIPKEMRNTLTDYEEFYKTQHGNRNVKWHHGLGSAVVSANFRKGCRKELVATMYQAVIILLFNKCEIWTVDEIVECTKIEKMEVVKNVLAMLGGKDKPRILVRVEDGMGKKESSVETVKTDKFVVNSTFADKRCRVRLAQVNIKTVVEEKKDIDNEVNQDRQYQIDACVVRIMKARKELTHPVLMNEVLQQLKFPVKATDIKIRLESLIERDYISRDENDSSTYKYVA